MADALLVSILSLVNAFTLLISSELVSFLSLLLLQTLVIDQAGCQLKVIVDKFCQQSDGRVRAYKKINSNCCYYQDY